ncbi:hypothetical protein GGR52DRAFT_401474 [Hypoxylon sp. FL1284]|nr:hypothetical protein GGR52DRAFT_401474 [Hypoxylon sp. FL1284]
MNPFNNVVISLDAKKLQSQHTTEGYRDGISHGKTDRIQAGFDDGYELGAELGLSAGRILGLLEGLVDSFNDVGLSTNGRIDELLSAATRELGEGSIFARDYWHEDGSWKYPVDEPVSKHGSLSENVANSHPAITKWAAKVDHGMKH